MKRFFVLYITFLGIVSVNAQSISTDSVIRVSQGGSDTLESLVVKVPITNLTADTLKLDWKRLINAYDSSSWSGTLICDLNNCYPASTFANPVNSPSIVLPNTTVNFSVTFNSNENPGTGHVQLAIYVVGQDSATRYSDVYLTLNNTTGIKTVSADMVSIYPNPATDYVTIRYKEGTPLNRVEVYSMLGRKVLAQKINSTESTNKIDLSDMPKGLYMVRVFDESNNVVLTKSISHVR